MKNLEFDIFNENEQKNIVIPLTSQKKTPTYEFPKDGNLLETKTKSTLSVENCSLQPLLKNSTQNLKQSEVLQHSIFLNLLKEFKMARDAVAKHELECLIVEYLDKQKEEQMKHYLLTIDWATKYIAYLYEDKNIRPIEIDNCYLMNNNRQLNQDFFVVNDMLWHFLREEYRGGPEILLDQYTETMRGQYRAHSFQSIERKMMSRNEDYSSPSNLILLPMKKKISFEIPLVGLQNDSNYCYMHSGLQSLLCIQELNYLLLAKIRPRLYQNDSTSRLLQSQLQITIKYLELIEQMRSQESENMRIGDLRRQISKKFNPKMQHDCQEFLLYLLSTMQDELSSLALETNKIKQKQMDTNIIDQIFKGQIESRMRCSFRGCNNTTSRFEPFLSLSLALNRNKDLRQCLDEFFHEETIKDYRCEKCHQQVMGQKRMYLAQMPRNIIFHLKRFKLFPNQQKISHFIQFPFDGLDLNDFQGKGRSQKPNYRLRAVVVHEGGLTGGHYYSFGRRFHNWFRFNDEEITRVSSRDIIHEQVYLLIYTHLDA